MGNQGLSVMVAAMVAMGALTARGAAVLQVPFDGDLSAAGSGGWTAAEGQGKLSFVDKPTRLGKAALVPKGVGPLRFGSKSPTLPAKGALSVWIASGDVKGFDGTELNLLSLKTADGSIQLRKSADGRLTARVERGGAVSGYARPFYDFLPAYPRSGWDDKEKKTVVRPGEPEFRHFVTLQWGGADEGLYVNAIKADKAEIAAAPAVELGVLALGDAASALYFDELLLTDAPKPLRAIRGDYLAYVTGKRDYPLPMLNVTENSGAPITIDGSLDDKAWDSASVIRGIHELDGKNLLPYDAAFYFTYDKEKFYVGLKTFAGYDLMSEAGKDGKKDNTGVCMDDCLEVMLMPYEAIRYDYFHFLGNSLGYFADQLGTDVSWNGKWEYKCQVKDGVWTAELAIPYGSLAGSSERATYPKGDAKWRFNVARNWQHVLPHWAGLSYAGNYGDYGKFGQMSFESVGVAPRVLSMERKDGAFVLKIEFLNSGKEKRTLDCALSAFTGILPFAEDKKRVELEPGARKTEELVIKGGAEKSCAVTWEAVDAASGAILLQGSGRLPFLESKLDEYNKRKAEIAAEKKKLEEAQKSADAGQKAETATETGSVMWPTPDVVDAELVKRREWKNNAIGVTDKVPPPWTPVKLDGAKASVWGRTYDFTGSLFLKGVAIQGRQMLADPVRLVVEKGNGKRVVYEDAETTAVDLTERSVQFVAVGGDDDLTVSVTTTLEFDGCAWLEVKVLPKRPVAFERLWLEVPCRREEARCFSYFVDKESGSNCGKVPEAGIAETFRPYVWLGDVDRGLCWFVEDHREWYIKEPATTTMTLIDTKLDSDATVMRIKLGEEKGARLDAPMRFEFGLMGTPVKPRLVNWRRYDNFCGWSKLKGQFTEWGTGYFIKEPQDPDDFRQRLKQFAETDKYIIATPNCASYYFIETNYKDGRTYPGYWMWGDEFAQTERPGWKVERQVWRKPDDPKKYSVGYTTAFPTKEYTDWYVFNYHKLLADFPDLRGVYMDTCIPEGDNRLNGTGYTDRYGTRHGTIGIMSSRRFLQRVYQMFWQDSGDPSANPWCVYVHCSNQLCPPIHAFATTMLQGEGLSVGPRAFQEHPLEALPMDAMRVGYNGHPYGWNDEFLGLYTENPEISAELLAMFLLNDDMFCGRGVGAVNERFGLAAKQAGLAAGDDAIAFVPYWSPEKAVAAAPAGVYANAYIKKKEGRTILVVGSLKAGDAPSAAALTLDRAKLGLPADGALAVRDLYTGERLIVDGTTLRLPILKNDFRIVEITPETGK